MPRRSPADERGGASALRLACAALAVAAMAAVAACAEGGRFSEPNARAHINTLAGSIGSRPTGTDANRRAREYLVDRLRLFGFEVRVQERDAVRAEYGRTARVANIIAVHAGARREAIALVSHYDSVAEAPGAADAALGTAVCLEAGRLLAAANLQHTLLVVLTDGEELGLMGAAAFLDDPAMRSVQAYLNFEAVGSAGPSLLFETGPGNAWLTRAWSRHAPQPRGSSVATEIYARLPNDTDFSMLARTGTPGLNFAPIEETYTYHTARDVPDRIPPATVAQTGETAVALVEALDRLDLSQRSGDTAVFYDIAAAGALAYTPLTARILALLAIVAGFVAWVRVLASVHRAAGLLRLLATAVWTLAGLALVFGAMAGAAWLIRAFREVYHPWYAHPARFFVFVAAAGLCAGWLLTGLALRLPARWRGPGGPSVVWALTLPAWLALAAVAAIMTPGASHMLVVPLLAAGVLLASAGAARPDVVRIVTIIVLGITGAVWIDDAVRLLHFSVGLLGRFSFITPIYVHPALMFAFGLVLVPPVAAALAGAVPAARRALVTRGLLFVFAASGGLAYMAPAYTPERPQRKAARYVADLAASRAYWEVGGNDLGVDLMNNPPEAGQWRPSSDESPLDLPVGPVGGPFRFRARAGQVGPAPARISGTIGSEPGGRLRVELTAMPAEEGLTAAFVLPPGVTPIESNLAGVVRGGRWQAVYSAIPREGVTLRLALHAADEPSLPSARVVLIQPGLPGGSGWQRLPAWLPQGSSVWTARSLFVVPVGNASEH